MDHLPLSAFKRPIVIAALHLPPFPGSGHPDAQPLRAITEYALRNIARAVSVGAEPEKDA